MNSGRYFIETFGCQMNVNDSERAAGLFEREGMSRADSAEAADVIFVNTCAVREKASEKLFHAVGRYKSLRKERPHLKVAVGGCVAQLQGSEIVDRAPAVDVLVGTHNLAELPDLVRRATRTGERQVSLDRKADAFAVPAETVAHSSPVRAYITAIEGCNHVCSFCVVPRTRGTEVCRSPESIEGEVRDLLERGYHEVMLLGQTVNAYQSGEVDFPGLLRRVHGLDSRLWRLRFTTSHPAHVNQAFADCFAQLPRLAPYLHLPVQSGSDRVLAEMRRGYTAAEYLAKLEMLRNSRSDIALTADIIVGYPGETEAEFEETCRLVEQARFDGLFVFLYSPRPGTTAARLTDDVPEEEKKRRFRVLNEQQQRYQRENNRRRVGSIEEVVIEEIGAEDFSGRTPHFRLVHTPLPHGRTLKVGERVNVQITDAFPNSLRGRFTG